jgi:hypothetical protein
MEHFILLEKPPEGASRFAVAGTIFHGFLLVNPAQALYAYTCQYVLD